MSSFSSRTYAYRNGSVMNDNNMSKGKAAHHRHRSQSSAGSSSGLRSSSPFRLVDIERFVARMQRTYRDQSRKAFVARYTSYFSHVASLVHTRRRHRQPAILSEGAVVRLFFKGLPKDLAIAIQAKMSARGWGSPVTGFHLPASAVPHLLRWARQDIAVPKRQPQVHKLALVVNTVEQNILRAQSPARVPTKPTPSSSRSGSAGDARRKYFEYLGIPNDDDAEELDRRRRRSPAPSPPPSRSLHTVQHSHPASPRVRPSPYTIPSASSSRLPPPPVPAPIKPSALVARPVCVDQAYVAHQLDLATKRVEGKLRNLRQQEQMLKYSLLAPVLTQLDDLRVRFSAENLKLSDTKKVFDAVLKGVVGTLCVHGSYGEGDCGNRIVGGNASDLDKAQRRAAISRGKRHRTIPYDQSPLRESDAMDVDDE